MDSTELKKIQKEITLLEMKAEMTDLDGGNPAYYNEELAKLNKKLKFLTEPDIDITY